MNTHINNHTIITFTFYKSMRKNAKCSDIEIMHYETTDKNQNTEKIVNAISKILPILKEYKNMIVRPCVTIRKPVERKTLNNPNYKEENFFTCFFEKKQVYSFEQVINEVYKVYSMAICDSMLSAEDLYDNSSIKYFIRKFYHD